MFQRSNPLSPRPIKSHELWWMRILFKPPQNTILHLKLDSNPRQDEPKIVRPELISYFWSGGNLLTDNFWNCEAQNEKSHVENQITDTENETTLNAPEQPTDPEADTSKECLSERIRDSPRGANHWSYRGSEASDLFGSEDWLSWVPHPCWSLFWFCTVRQCWRNAWIKVMLNQFLLCIGTCVSHLCTFCSAEPSGEQGTVKRKCLRSQKLTHYQLQSDALNHLAEKYPQANFTAAIKPHDVNSKHFYDYWVSIFFILSVEWKYETSKWWKQPENIDTNRKFWSTKIYKPTKLSWK